MSNDFENWVSHIKDWRDSTSHIPALISQDIEKGKYRPKAPTESFKALQEDPLAIQYSLGFKDRNFSLTYDIIKQVVQNLSVIGAIIAVRTNQVASFSVPYRLSKSLGFQIKHKNPGRLTTKGEREMILDLEKFIYNCGADQENPHNVETKRDDFETFLKKITRDSITYDQVCFELVPNRRGQPFEFMAVDASTIRIATSNKAFGPNDTWHDRPPPAAAHWGTSLSNPYRSLKLSKDPDKRPAYVQVINGQIYNTFTRNELAFGVRNPRTDIYVQGYGYGEIEQLITIITAHLHAEEYNRKFFMQGSAPKGILSLKGDATDTTQLEGFKRQWHANLSGTQNSWKTPIIQTEQGVDWINLNPNNRDMEYNSWLEYLIKVSTALFLIDPAELNFDLHGGVSQTPLFESSAEWKLKASRDKGLKPLLRFLAKLVNDNVVSKIDDHFVFDFVGLDELTEQEKHELRKEQVSTYRTLNEIRREDDLPDLDGGDVPMNPVYLQSLQVRNQIKAQESQGGAGGEAQQQGPQEGEDNTEQDKNVPQYEGVFAKSVSKPVLEISIDEDYDQWIDLWRG